MSDDRSTRDQLAAETLARLDEQDDRRRAAQEAAGIANSSDESILEASAREPTHTRILAAAILAQDLAEAVLTMSGITRQQRESSTLHHNAYEKSYAHGLEHARLLTRLLAGITGTGGVLALALPQQAVQARELAQLVLAAAHLQHIEASPLAIAAARLVANPHYLLAELADAPLTDADYYRRQIRLESILPGRWSDLPPGWLPIAEQLAIRLNLEIPDHLRNQRVAAFEERRGALNVRLSGPAGVPVDIACYMAERQAALACVVCGAPREDTGLSGISATCRKHRGAGGRLIPRPSSTMN